MASNNKYDKTHLRNLKIIQTRVQRIFDAAAQEASAIGQMVVRAMNIDKNNPLQKPFEFNDYPMTKQRTQQLLNTLHKNLNVAITSGVRNEWTLANNKNNELCNVVFANSKSKLTSGQSQKYYSTNPKALEAFAQRKELGLNLSDRVWKYTEQFKNEIEMGIDVGIRDGLPADEMSRQLRKYLQQPDKLFRRYRDEHGILQLSKKAKAYHPGQGVYRSSYKNARRTAATECNMSYRTADHLRYQQMDFVVGVEVHLSNNHTTNGVKLVDVCDKLAGRYPKDFKFVGWHPHCRCYVTSILKTDKEIAEDTKRLMRGEKPTTDSVNSVKDVPDNFKQWCSDNKDRLSAMKNKPYFVQDNAKYVNQVQTPVAGVLNDKPNNNNKRQYHLLPEYKSNSDVDDTFKKINNELTDKWFVNGDLKLDSINNPTVNGFTYRDGRISLRAERLEGVKKALGKIGSGKANDITEHEADSMATFWHEITHNRNTCGYVRMTDRQTSIMEMMNEFVARKTLPEFYEKLGSNKLPHPEFMNNRNSTGYNRKVIDFDFVIQKLGLDKQKVLESAKQNLFNTPYNKQENTAVQALIDGGLDTFKCANGKKIGKLQIKTIVKICSNSRTMEDIERFMKKEGIISK